MTKFYYMLAGDSFSDMIDGYALGYPGDETLFGIEYDMRKDKYGHEDFDSCVDEAQVALYESGATFAVVFQGSKLFGVITKDKTITFEVM